MKRLVLLVVILVLLVAIAIFLGDLCAVPPASTTVSAITECAVRSQLFYEGHGTLPSSLVSLPKRNGYANSIVDGYARQLVFEVRADRLVFISYGKDGVPGGVEENSDTEIHYLTHRPDGSLWIGEPNWIVEAERRIQSPLARQQVDLLSQRPHGFGASCEADFVRIP